MTIRLIPQREPNDCVICSIAMATGHSYENVLSAAGDLYDPDAGVKSVERVLEQLGFTFRLENGANGWGAGAEGELADLLVMSRGIITADYFRNFAWGRRALATVQSKRIANGFHMVWWDGREAWDPAPEHRIERFEQLFPTELILWREGR
jgi:hypothetical protein